MVRQIFPSPRLVFLFSVVALLLCSCQAVAVDSSEDFSGLETSSARFLFWEKCEDRWNKEKKVTEKCCKGNYKCSSDICKDNRLCSIGLFGGLLWCHVDKCRPSKEKEDDADEGKESDKDKDKEKDEPQASGEPEVDDTVDGEDEEDPEEPTSESPSPTPSMSASPSASQSASPSPAPPNNDPLHCNGRRNRREIRDMTPGQRQDWRQAIMELRADRDENGDSEWDRLVLVHMNFADEAHGGSFFLPWHRLFLLRLENALRRKRPNLALPYWDWTIDAQDAALSQVWNPGFAGGAQRGNNPIQSGPFQNMDARHPDNHIVRRNFTSGVSGEIPLLWRMDSLNQLINGGSWPDFANGIESAHALPHVFIGGNMQRVRRAPNDPIFYLHHAFVDYLYSLRQQQSGTNQFGGTHDFQGGTQPARPGRVLQAFGVPASRAFNLECVNYVQPSTQGRTIAGRGARPQDVCANEIFTNGEGLTRDRCRRGEEVLERTQ